MLSSRRTATNDGGVPWTPALCDVREDDGTNAQEYVVPYEEADVSGDGDIELLYHLDESDAVTDDSDNSNDGTLSGKPVTHADGVFSGECVDFDGTDDYTYATDDGTLEVSSGDFTLEAWINPDTLSGTQVIASKWSDGDKGYMLYLNGANVTGKVYDGTSETTVTGSTSLSAGTWYHVVLQRSVNDLTVWVSGAQDGSTTFSNTVNDTAEDFRVGARESTGSTITEHFDGRIDEVMLASVALYTGEPATDESVNANDADLDADATLAEGRFDQALELDGTGDSGEVADDASLELGSNDFTLEAYVNPDSTTGQRAILSKWEASNKSYKLYLDGGTLKLDLSSDGSATTTIAGSSSVSTDAWTHVAACLDSSTNTVTLYLDGESDGTGSWSSAVYDGTAKLRFGAIGISGSEEYFDGTIDEARVSTTDRGANLLKETILYHYNARNQLTKAEDGDAGNTNWYAEYAYDKNGNQTQVTHYSGDSGTTVAEHSYTYDVLNRMLSYAGPRGGESHSYRGAEWHRSSTSANSGTTTKFLYDGDNVVADLKPGGGGLSVDRFYVTPFLDQNLSMTDVVGGETYYYSHDGLGSVRTVTDSSTGAVVNAYDYDAFGQVYAPNTTVSVSQRYTYTGREKSAVEGPLYYRYRHYHPGIGRFGGRDPWGYLPNPQGNIYNYVSNRPVGFIDPSGRVTTYTDWATVPSTIKGVGDVGRVKYTVAQASCKEGGHVWIQGNMEWAEGGHPDTMLGVELSDVMELWGDWNNEDWGIGVAFMEFLYDPDWKQGPYRRTKYGCIQPIGDDECDRLERTLTIFVKMKIRFGVVSIPWILEDGRALHETPWRTIGKTEKKLRGVCCCVPDRRIPCASYK